MQWEDSTESVVYCLLVYDNNKKKTLQKHKVYATPESETDCEFIQAHKRKAQKANGNLLWAWWRMELAELALIDVGMGLGI